MDSADKLEFKHCEGEYRWVVADVEISRWWMKRLIRRLI